MIHGRYQIIDQFRPGGFGIVYKVLDNQDDNEYALKMCTESTEDGRKRFAREVRLMQSIDSENVVSVVDVNFEHEPPYFVMPLAICSLEDKLGEVKSNHELALKVFLKVCKGIQNLHNSKIIHRDIKPANVLIYPENKIVVSDLGLGKFEIRDSTILTSSNVFLGTEGYIPPEYKTKKGTKNADEKGDIYQLGKMLYYILTGEYPTLIQNNILPPSLTYIIQKATKELADERYQSVGELIDAINSYILATDPTSNPFQRFEANINTLQDLVERGQYDKKILDKILQIIYSTKEEQKSFFEFFDNLPEPILDICSNQFSGDFEPILIEYTNQLLDYIGSEKLGFSYAETVAKKMKRIYANSQRLDFKVLSLKNILIACVYFNRFAAMDIFSEILHSIKDNDEAVAISDMLRKEIDWFKTFSELPKKKLHISIQKVIELAEQMEKEENNNDLELDELW